MGTRKAASAAKKKTESESEMTMSLPVFHNKDGTIDVDGSLNGVLDALGDEERDKALSHLRKVLGPEGIVETYRATWGSGRTGKYIVCSSAVGTVTVLAALAEAVGWAGGWDNIRPTNWVQR